MQLQNIPKNCLYDTITWHDDNFNDEWPCNLIITNNNHIICVQHKQMSYNHNAQTDANLYQYSKDIINLTVWMATVVFVIQCKVIPINNKGRNRNLTFTNATASNTIYSNTIKIKHLFMYITRTITI